MSIEFIGHVFPHEMSETIARTGPVVQPDYLRALSRAHEASGFDLVLIPHSSSMVDGFIVADQVLSATERLGVLLAHRPGFVAPDPGRPQVRDDRRIPSGPDRDARHHRRRRGRPGA